MSNSPCEVFRRYDETDLGEATPGPPYQVFNISNSIGSMSSPQHMPTYLQQTTSPFLPPQQSPQPRPITQRQAGQAPAPRPKPRPTETIASIETKLEARNKELSKIGEKKAAREKERKALGPRRQKMGEQKYMNEYRRLTDAISRLERQRSDELAKKDELLVELKRVKAQTV